MAEDDGHVFTLIRSYICKYLMPNNLEARRIEPLFLIAKSSEIQERLYPRGFGESKASQYWHTDADANQRR
jgi:hypothetical protein